MHFNDVNALEFDSRCAVSISSFSIETQTPFRCMKTTTTAAVAAIVCLSMFSHLENVHDSQSMRMSEQNDRAWRKKLYQTSN